MPGPFTGFMYGNSSTGPTGATGPSGAAGGTGPTATNAYFNGYMANTSTWSTTSTTFADLVNSGGNALTTVAFNGITVSAAGNSLAAVVFVPASATAAYMVDTTILGFNNSGAVQLELTDGTTAFAWGGCGNGFSTGEVIGYPVGGVYQCASGATVTIRVRAATSSGGTANISHDGEFTAGTPPTISWRFVQIR